MKNGILVKRISTIAQVETNVGSDIVSTDTIGYFE